MPLTKEAYKKLNDNTDGIRFIRPFSEYTLQEVIDALNELEELKQRDTPMKWIDVVDETGHYDKCPVCDYPSYNDLGHNHFCTVCGQRLEFEEVGNEE